MNDIITGFLAELLEKFKLKNPKVYAVVVVVLLTAVYVAQQGTVFGLFTLSPAVSGIITWISVILAALFSSQTFAYLKPTSQAKRPPLSSGK